jgi:hypothetical protein
MEEPFLSATKQLWTGSGLIPETVQRIKKSANRVSSLFLFSPQFYYFGRQGMAH